MEIFPRVHWLDLRYVNVYLVVGEGEMALVDCGQPKQHNKILDYVRSLGRAPTAITHILLTHADWDHAGSAAALQAATGARVYCSPETAAFLRSGVSPKHLPRPVQFIADRFLRFTPIAADSITEHTPDDGPLPFLDGLTIMATPGHTPDHHAFYSPMSGVLFAGDALQTRGGSLGGSPPRITADVEAARRSARRLLALAPALIACGHGPPLQGHSNEDVMGLLQTLAD